MATSVTGPKHGHPTPGNRGEFQIPAPTTVPGKARDNGLYEDQIPPGGS